MFWRWAVFVFLLTPCLCQNRVFEEKTGFDSSSGTSFNSDDDEARLLLLQASSLFGGREQREVLVQDEEGSPGRSQVELLVSTVGENMDSSDYRRRGGGGGFPAGGSYSAPSPASAFVGSVVGGGGSNSWNLWHNDQEETVSEASVDLSSASLVNGITFDIVQHYKTFVEFYPLPHDESDVQVRLLVRGRNSAIQSSDPQLQIGVASLASGPQIRVTVGEDNYDWLWTYLWLGVSLLVAAAVFALWSLRSSRRWTSLRHTEEVAGEYSDSTHLDRASKYTNTLSEPYT